MLESPVVLEWQNAAREVERIENHRSFLRRVLERRFGSPITPEILAVIKAQPSVPLLLDWFDAAMSATSIEEFLAVVRR